jgi:hypothetical protein
MSWTCSECRWEWDTVWQFFYIDHRQLCLACETDLTDEDRERGEFKRLKQKQTNCLTCPCNGKTYATLAKLNTHAKTKGHQKWVLTVSFS